VISIGDCGVLGIVLKEDSEKLGIYAKIGLGTLNHRGEDAHGISFFNPQKGQVETIKSLGLVRDCRFFDKPISGSFLIGHTRYRTSSTDSLENAQPIQFALSDGKNAAIAHNGNLTNDKEILKDELRSSQEGVSDTRVLGMLLGKSLRNVNVVESVREALRKVRGSYSITMLVEDNEPGIVAVKDPYGYMPLRVGSNEEGFFVASESVAFDRKYLNAKSREMAPGEMVMINKRGIVSYQLFESERKQHCMFQPIYMCRPDSVFEGSGVSAIRERLGYEIGTNYKPNVHMVLPVPESGLPISFGYSQATGIPVHMGIVRDRYESGRSFMQDNQEKRESVASKKFNIVSEIVNGKSVVLVEDSVVRGTTMRGLIAELRYCGAIEVHVAFACPPIVSECRYGIDFYNKNLIARPFKDRPRDEMNREIAKIIQANSVYYQTIDGMVNAIGVKKENLCLSCLTGVYVQPGSFSSEEDRKR
jgi:amidophosphoribosyltransferase